MKRLITLAAAIALLTVADTAFAQQGDKGKKGKDEQRQGQQQNRGARQGGEQERGDRRGGGKGQKGGQRGGKEGGGGGLFRLLDTDRDGKLSAKEIDGAVAALMKLDTNKDGILDAQELVVRSGGGRGGQGRTAIPNKTKPRKGAKAQRKEGR